jgi:branched-chain amino acid transport system ATP-binding protein
LPSNDLAASGITVRFGGVTALEDVSLRAGTDEVVGVIGPNGAGKTTLFNVICGFVRPDDGSLTWDGRPLEGHRPHQLARLGIGRTLQGVGLFPELTALENVMTGAHCYRRARLWSSLLGLPRADRDERALREAAHAALTRFGVDRAADRFPGELPFPVQKRVALARALAGRPRMLLLDEPAGGLGEADMAELGATIRELRGEMGVLLVEHHMDLVMSVCDRVIVLDFGRVIAEGPPETVRSDPRVLDAYLGLEADHGDEAPSLAGSARADSVTPPRSAGDA